MSKSAPAHNKTELGNFPLLTNFNHVTWKETMTLVIEVMDAYYIITREESEPPQIDIDYYGLEIQDTRAKTTTYLSCTRTIQFRLKSL
jgi:hypothetical protein